MFCERVCFDVCRHMFYCLVPSERQHSFKFTVYEVSYEEGILWQKIHVSPYIILQGKGGFKLRKKINSL